MRFDIAVCQRLNYAAVLQEGGFAIYTINGWQGTLSHLYPGCGYLYISNESKTLGIGVGNKTLPY